jgi:hypothetical protein
VAASTAVLLAGAVLNPAALSAQEILAPTNVPSVLTIPINPGDTNANAPFTLNNSGAVRLQALVPIDGATLSVTDSSDVTRGDSAILFTSSNDLGAAGVPGGSFVLEDFVLPAGEYRANFTFPAADQQTAIMVTVGNSADAGGPAYEIAVVVPKSRVVLGDVATFGVLLLKDGLPLTGLQPELTMISETGLSTPVALTDDGQEADGLADDGLYSSELELGTIGTQDLEAGISFIDEGRVIELTASGSVEVLPQSAEIVDVQSQLIVAPEGCVDGLSQTVALSIIDPGTYIVAGGIVSDSGVIEERVNDDYAPGIAETVLEFGAEQLRNAVGTSSTIQSVNPELFSLGEVIDLQDAAPRPLDLMVSADQICRDEPIAFGSVSAQPIVIDNLIATLEFTVNVDVEDGGTYQLSFEVSGGGQEVAIVSLNRTLQTGVNNVTFQISASEVQTIDGPYELTSGLVIGRSGALQRSNLGLSDFYSRWQFTPDREGDLDADGDVDRDDFDLLASFRNEAALSPGDRRDLNGDRVIDIRDLRMMVRLR